METGPSSPVDYYPVGSLPLKVAQSGARYWAVALQQTMLTYFEVGPGVRFETHQHVSEQITAVIEGELFFEGDGWSVTVATGEVIAIPANVPHAVFTRERAVRAFDAWSPVPARYREDAPS